MGFAMLNSYTSFGIILSAKPAGTGIVGFPFANLLTLRPESQNHIKINVGGDQQFLASLELHVFSINLPTRPDINSANIKVESPIDHHVLEINGGRKRNTHNNNCCVEEQNKNEHALDDIMPPLGRWNCLKQISIKVVRKKVVVTNILERLKGIGIDFTEILVNQIQRKLSMRMMNSVVAATPITEEINHKQSSLEKSRRFSPVKKSITIETVPFVNSGVIGHRANNLSSMEEKSRT